MLHSQATVDQQQIKAFKELHHIQHPPKLLLLVSVLLVYSGGGDLPSVVVVVAVLVVVVGDWGVKALWSSRNQEMVCKRCCCILVYNYGFLKGNSGVGQDSLKIQKLYRNQYRKKIQQEKQAESKIGEIYKNNTRKIQSCIFQLIWRHQVFTAFEER